MIKETLVDIIAEKRNNADKIEKEEDNQFARELVKMIRYDADRLEAARKLEVAELRKTLKCIAVHLRVFNRDGLNFSQSQWIQHTLDIAQAAYRSSAVSCETRSLKS